MGKPITLQIKGNGGISLGMSPKGTTNYPSLTNKPSINDVELVDNKTSSDLGLQDEMVPITEQDIDEIMYGG